MNENILLFLLFAFGVIILYYLVKPAYRKYVLLFGSAVFYCVVSGWLFLLLMAETVYSYCAVKICAKRKHPNIIIPIIPIIVILLFWKYNGFFAESIKSGLDLFGLETGIHTLNLVLPLGLSFYTFKIISFMADVCKRKIAIPKFTDYCTYILCFTQIMSGPIQRADEFIVQIEKEVFCNKEMVMQGLYRILLGLFKKLVVAARCTGYVGTIFENPQSYPVLSLWMAAFLFSIELYADFSGYSDIAIGLMQIMGIRVKENFATPYFSHNIKEFWERWHISLSSWLKDYIYIPLGGNRCSVFRQKLNVMITFLISGLWHGAGWNYVLWGAVHGVLNCLTPSKKSGASKGIKGVVATLLTYACVNFAWIIFRADSLENAFLYLKSMFGKPNLSFAGVSQMLLPFTGDNTCAVYAVVLFIFIASLLAYDGICYYRKKEPGPKMSFIWQVFLVVAVILFGVVGQSGFIYAQY